MEDTPILDNIDSYMFIFLFELFVTQVFSLRLSIARVKSYRDYKTPSIFAPVREIENAKDR
jgi:hypothetical protein